MAHSFQHAANLPVAAFRNRDPIPAVGALSTTVFDGPKLGDTVFELDTIQQGLLLLLGESTKHTNRIFTLQPKTGVHQIIRKLA
jgi:hypothetical protein